MPRNSKLLSENSNQPLISLHYRVAICDLQLLVGSRVWCTYTSSYISWLDFQQFPRVIRGMLYVISKLLLVNIHNAPLLVNVLCKITFN
uniref:Uncharacterized protein n=1 Tax=Solanum tuberosum TaxID=4113 RepID=M1CJQ9_SOLTU